MVKIFGKDQLKLVHLFNSSCYRHSNYGEAGCTREIPVRPIASVAQGKHFSFPPVLEDAPTFSVHTKGSSSSKSTLRREAIRLYRISRRELKKRLL